MEIRQEQSEEWVIKMKVMEINSFGNLSTGRIAVDIYRMLIQNGDQGLVAYARNSVPEDVAGYKIETGINILLDGVFTRITDRAGFFSRRATKRLVRVIEEYDPDIIHLHNLHGYYLNIKVLFEYLQQNEKPVVWTLHDCWAFTGHCCYYSMAGCEKWKSKCSNCPQKNEYPASMWKDNSERNYKEKKELFTSLPRLYLVTVSKWLEEEVKKSFLKQIPCTTIYNGIDREIFKPTSSDFREMYGLDNKFIILGVASTWTVRKGIKDFVRLAEILDKDERIVLVGVSDKEKRILPRTITCIERTDDIKELAGIYTAADVFFNASIEETFGLPTAEAIACATPVIVYNTTALPEVVSKSNGFVCEPHDLEKVHRCIESIRSGEAAFDFDVMPYEKNRCYEKYIQLYEEIYKDFADRFGKKQTENISVQRKP